jgi:serine protease Do
VYIVDAHANNPGAAGGALIDWQGNLLGILGKELKSRVTGSWLHYAIPVEQFADAASDMMAGRSLQLSTDGLVMPDDPLTLADLGLVLTPNVLPRTPPYVDGVLPNSAAAAAGLRPDDLVVFVAGQPTASCTAVMESLARREKYEQVRLSVLRDGRLIETDLSADGADARRQREVEGLDSRP